MCRGTTLIYRCCGKREIALDDDDDFYCQEYYENVPHHRVMGPVHRRRECIGCRIRREEQAINERMEYNRHTRRAKAVLEYLNGERDSPYTDEERGQQQMTRECRLDLLRSSRNIIDGLVHRDAQQRLINEEDGEERQPGRLAGISDPSDYPHIPVGFREWSRINRWDIPDGTLDREIECYLDYLQTFPDINYPDRWMAAAHEILEDASETLEFIPDVNSGHLMTFNTFIRTTVPPVPQTFGYFGEGARRYARYLFAHGSNELYWRFLNFRTRVGQDIRSYLNTLSPIGRAYQEGENESIQTFREWTASHIRVLDPEPAADIRLQMDVDDYEHSYLGQNADARMLLAFRDQRERLRDSKFRNFNFHPHTTGVQGFREFFENNGCSESAWFEGLEHYSQYLDNLGQRAIAQRFSEARAQFAAEDRREFEGRARLNPHSRPDVIPDTTRSSDTELGTRLLNDADELRRQLVGSLFSPRSVIPVALLSISSMLHQYKAAIAAGRQMTLEEWDAIAEELNKLRIVFLPISQSVNPGFGGHCPAETSNAANVGNTLNQPITPELFDTPSRIADYTIVPHRRASYPAREAGEWVMVEPRWLSQEDSSNSSNGSLNFNHLGPVNHRDLDGGFQDMLFNQIEQENQLLRDREARRRHRQRNNLRPLTPDGDEGDESDIDPDDLMAMMQGVILEPRDP